ncbi:hypothetical protein FJ970_05720 [Mesorhizobium sp. B2-1-8]|uniref:hypothetical protein n=1 Tax=unclassified Mesorhizobium TaxID=325217 RepID=UPI00112A75BE|nr:MULTISPECIES: hypothetical protein [unclassified Mesorhizobium]MBZ9670238.1 hypothetical protein [Mesorhizobium sp. ES1-3]MBZ9707471.1 hypothetical protein [Mesorhizobium sp. ESP7-2]UCI20460.1 hypothetical protein FJ970_05720 [Mesorhizobium sp. B2-1-8]
MSGKLVTAVVFDNQPEAEVCVSMLSAYGIYALANRILDTSKQGLVHVQVVDSDLEAAKGLISPVPKASD